MDLVEQGGNLLDLVDDHLPRRVRARRLQLLAQLLGPADVATELVRLEQINPYGVGVPLSEQGALARLPRSPKKESLSPGLRQC